MSKSVCNEEYVVEKIVGCSFDDDKLQFTKFKVKWVGWTPRHNTDEPLDHLLACPLLVQRYLDRSGRNVGNNREMDKDLSQQTRARLLAGNIEVVPARDWVLKKIHDQFWINDVPYYSVTFSNQSLQGRHVRRCVIDFFYPIQSMLFLQRWYKRFPNEKLKFNSIYSDKKTD